MKFSSHRLFSGIAAAAATAGIFSLTSGGTSQVHAAATPGSAVADVPIVLTANVSPAQRDAYSSYTVRSGDTLSGISRKEYGSADCWPGIWGANTGKISNPDLIYVGQEFSIPSGCSTHGPAIQTASVSGGTRPIGQGDGDSNPVSQVQAPPPSNGYQVTSSFQACVIRAESGGNPYIWNATGHWGLYQFSYSTWVAHGGAPADFGHAGPAEQTVVFWQTVHDDGTSDWAPYDGC